MLCGHRFIVSWQDCTSSTGNISMAIADKIFWNWPCLCLDNLGALAIGSITQVLYRMLLPYGSQDRVDPSRSQGNSWLCKQSVQNFVIFGVVSKCLVWQQGKQTENSDMSHMLMVLGVPAHVCPFLRGISSRKCTDWPAILHFCCAKLFALSWPPCK